MENFKEKNKSFSIKLKPSLMEQVEDYISLVNETKTDKENKFKKVDFFNNILSDFFKGKILTNDYVTLKEPLYFNAKELLEEGSVNCSSVKPTTDLDNVQIIKRVPNNLDAINDKLFYSYEDYNSHKGIDFSVFYSDFKTVNDIKTSYLVFDLEYNTLKEDLVPNLTISCLKTNELSVYLDIHENKEIIKFLEDIKNNYTKGIEKIIELQATFPDVSEKKLEELPEEVIKNLAEFTFHLTKWLAYNYNCFIPVKVYSKIQQFIILLNEGTEEESKELEKMFNINKAELEEFIETFKLGRNTNLVLIFYKLNNEHIETSLNNDLDFMVNAFINGESNIVEAYTSYLISNYY